MNEEICGVLLRMMWVSRTLINDFLIFVIEESDLFVLVFAWGTEECWYSDQFADTPFPS